MDEEAEARRDRRRELLAKLNDSQADCVAEQNRRAIYRAVSGVRETIAVTCTIPDIRIVHRWLLGLPGDEIESVRSLIIRLAGACCNDPDEFMNSCVSHGLIGRDGAVDTGPWYGFESTYMTLIEDSRKSGRLFSFVSKSELKSWLSMPEDLGLGDLVGSREQITEAPFGWSLDEAKPKTFDDLQDFQTVSPVRTLGYEIVSSVPEQVQSTAIDVHGDRVAMLCAIESVKIPLSRLVGAAIGAQAAYMMGLCDWIFALV